ncbi:MAG: NAD(P)H-binding protein [Thermoplasmatota archaeon]
MERTFRHGDSLRVFLTGATGFVGTHVRATLRAAGHEVTAVARHVPAGFGDAGVHWLAADLSVPGGWADAVRGHDAVIHLVAAIRVRASVYERQIFGSAQTVIDAAVRAGVPRFILMSANGAARGRNPYADAKARAEEYLKTTSLRWTILRPSIIYGGHERDAKGRPMTQDFFTLLAANLRRMPAFPIFGDGQYRLAPVPATDVALAMTRSLTSDKAVGKTYTLCGPVAYTYEELLRALAQWTHHRRAFPKIPLSLVKGGLAAVDWIPRFPVTRTEVELLVQGNVCPDDAWRRDLEIPPGPSLMETMPAFV